MGLLCIAVFGWYRWWPKYNVPKVSEAPLIQQFRDYLGFWPSFKSSTSQNGTTSKDYWERAVNYFGSLWPTDDKDNNGNGDDAL